MTNIFSIQANFSELQKGEFNGHTFILGSDKTNHPELEYILLYKREEDEDPVVMITLSQKSIENPIQSLSFYSKDHFDSQLLFTETGRESFLLQSHELVSKWKEREPIVWAPPLKHHPKVVTSERTDFGSIAGHRYHYHENAETEDERISYALFCYAPREKKPSLVLYVEQLVDTNPKIHMYFTNKHSLSITSLKQNEEREQLIKIAKEKLENWQLETETDDVEFPIPILQLTPADINRILRQEQMYEHSLLIVLISLIGFVLFSLIGVPYIGWFFLIISIFCWMISAAHAIYSYASLYSSYAVRIPAATALLFPFFFPQYGPTLFLFCMMATPILLRKAITSKGIRLSGNGIQEDDKLLLVARKMHFDMKNRNK